MRQWNRLDEALDLALEGVRLSEQTETIVALYLGYTLLMRIYLARGEMDPARFAFQKAEEALTKTYSPYRRDAQYISLKPKGGNSRQESSHLAYCQKVKHQGAFDVQMTRNDGG